MTPHQERERLHKIWKALLAMEGKPETHQLLMLRRDITLKLRTVLPNKKGFGHQYEWNSPKFDRYITQAKEQS